jgi:cellulose biosynthesis protein BcsQ
VVASEYANLYPQTDVYVIDLCPQAHVSETLLGGYSNHSNGSERPIDSLIKQTPRATVAGYLEARLSSPFRIIEEVEPFLCQPGTFNPNIPPNLKLVCGDNLLEILSEAIRQISQLSIPRDAWKQVLSWIKDLIGALKEKSGDRDTLFILDCNPSFSVYTQLALVAADHLVVPFTADESSRRGIENVVALLYGIGNSHTAVYARINFAKRAKEDNVNVPFLHSFVNLATTNKRVKVFEVMNKAIKGTVDEIHNQHRTLFSNPKEPPSKSLIDIPDYHSACVVASTTGIPLHKLKVGHHSVFGERITILQEPLDRYRKAWAKLVSRF